MPTFRPTFVLAALLFASCATHGIRVPVLKPAPVNLVQFDRIAVDRFDGDGCEPFSDQLAEALRNSQNPMTGKTAFQVMHRREIDRAVDEIRDRHGADWDKRTMEVLDRWRSAQIVLQGHMVQHGVREELVEEPAVDQYARACTIRIRRCTAIVRVALQASDVEGKRVFDDTMLEATSSARTRAERGHDPAPIDQLALLANARDEVVANYLQRVLPHQVWVDVALYKDGDFPDLQVGNGYAETGNWPMAIQAYQRALSTMTGELAEYRHMALFNLGVAYEFTDQFAEARKVLQEAYAVGRDNMILGELQRVDMREQEVQRLKQQGEKPAEPAR